MISDRAQITRKLFNQKEKLTLDNKIYKQWVFRFTYLEVEKDLGEAGDITSNSLIHSKHDVTARIYANEEGIASGISEIVYFLMSGNTKFKPRLSPLNIIKSIKDGAAFEKDDILIEFKGDIKDVLKIERVILNFLQHMCGISTYSKQLTDIVKQANSNVLVVPTRKTTWGWLDKKAVAMAGGGTHRLNLEDAVLIKDNHIALYEKDPIKTLKNFAQPDFKYNFFEIEIDQKGQVQETAQYLVEMQYKELIPTPAVIMFDNMKPKDIEQLIDLLKKQNLYDELLFEASGGINEKNLESYARSGVDIISIGALTQKITPIDLSMEIGN